MTDECRPAAGAEPHSLHWLEHYPTLNSIVQEWEGDTWRFGVMSHSPSVVASWAYRYVAPASPDDATERARLAGENADLCARIHALKRSNARMRDALTFYANPQIYKPHPHGPAFDRRGDLASVAIEALRGTTP